ncbi:MAG: tRNA (adenosine(37)-N6)-dimethylallyltransferase MiaA [Muribaculaceae bacterium]|nr:tRNA (adenosine(37)-N6)-dimethylallyltransferase MiaA [Muribaculaceae bacterium]
MIEKTMIVITGPTASGKSALAVDVARELDTDIISADSRQIYQGIPIVTAVPTFEERGGVRHHLMEMLPLEAYYSASMFEQDALRLAEEIFRERDYVVVCGGSMMYIDALCNGIDELPTVSEEVRKSLMMRHITEGDEWLLEELRRHDETTWQRIDRKNIKRVFHALEVSIQAGRPYSSLLGGKKPERPFRIIKLFIDRERPELFERINKRVERMVEAGLIEEVRSVLGKRGLNSLNTVGVKEIFSYFDGDLSREEAIARIQKNTRVYAKKQMTWFSRDKDIEHVKSEEAIGRVRQLLEY